MEYRDQFKGHTINAWTDPAGDESWTWTYTIDDETRICRFDIPGKPEAAVLDAAIQDARARILQYPKD